MRSLTSTPFALVTGALVATFAVTACGSDSGDDAGGASSARVQHALGETETDGDPQRIVALGPGDRDAAIALGVDLVGTVPGPQGELNPWTEEALEGKDAPELLEVSGEGLEVDLEEVVELEPDLILASTYYEIDDAYEDLSQIAPTLAYQDDVLTDTWEQVTLSVGETLGRADDAQDLIDGVEQDLQDAGAAEDDLTGTTYTFGFATPDGVRVLRDPDDVMNTLSNALGFELSPAILDQPEDGFAVDVADENLDLLEADVLALYAPGGKGLESMEGNRLFDQLDVTQREAVVSFSDDDFFALRQPTALSLPWSIDNVAPELIDAAKR